MADVAEFERAVLIAFQYAGARATDQQAQALKLQAESFCAAVKAQADGWRAELQLFEHSGTSRSSSTRCRRCRRRWPLESRTTWPWP